MSPDIRFHQLLQSKIQETIVEKSMSLAKGGAPSFDQYKRQAGVIEGLREALSIAEDVEKTLFGSTQEKP